MIILGDCPWALPDFLDSKIAANCIPATSIPTLGPASIRIHLKLLFIFPLYFDISGGHTGNVSSNLNHGP
jgi:hypothetical protein